MSGPINDENTGLRSFNVSMGHDPLSFEYGRFYLICEKRVDRTLRILQDFTYSGTKAICVTRLHPERIRERMPGKDMESIWLSEAIGADNVAPDQLNRVLHRIAGFLVGKKDAVVLLEGVEYLCLFNDFSRVNMFVEQVNDLVMASGAILLIAIDPQSLEQRSLARLRRYAEVVA